MNEIEMKKENKKEKNRKKEKMINEDYKIFTRKRFRFSSHKFTSFTFFFSDFVHFNN